MKNTWFAWLGLFQVMAEFLRGYKSICSWLEISRNCTGLGKAERFTACLPLVSHLSPTCLPLVPHLCPTCVLPCLLLLVSDTNGVAKMKPRGMRKCCCAQLTWIKHCQHQELVKPQTCIQSAMDMERKNCLGSGCDFLSFFLMCPKSSFSSG